MRSTTPRKFRSILTGRAPAKSVFFGAAPGAVVRGGSAARRAGERRGGKGWRCPWAHEMPKWRESRRVLFRSESFARSSRAGHRQRACSSGRLLGQWSAGGPRLGERESGGEGKGGGVRGRTRCLSGGSQGVCSSDLKFSLDPHGRGTGKERVLRGGSWGSGPRGVRVSVRLRFVPSYRGSFSGLRCAGAF